MTWQPIDTLKPEDRPRQGRVLIYCADSSRPVKEAWWSMPYENAPPEQCCWQTMDGAVLSADIHKSPQGRPLGATDWMPMPAGPLNDQQRGKP